MSNDIVIAMITNTLEVYDIRPLYESSDITKVSAMYKEIMYSYKSLDINELIYLIEFNTSDACCKF